MAVTFKVYDGGTKFDLDRYTLYVPVPRNKTREFGAKGSLLGFSFKHNQIIKCCWENIEVGTPIRGLNLGKRIDRKTLPIYVQNWIERMENTYNRAVKTNDDLIWEEFNKM